MVKNRFKDIFVRLLVLVCTVTILFCFCGFDSTQQKVYDNANILDSGEEAKLQQMCVQYAQEAEIDIIILTDKNTTRKSSMTYTEDFYMAHDFGYDTLHGDGVILLIDMYKREVWISTSGKAIDYLSDKRIDNLVTKVTGSLSAGNYYSACSDFITQTASYMKTKPSASDAKGSGNTIYVHEAASLTERLLYKLPFKLLLSIGAALIITFILAQSSQNKARMTVGTRHYMNNNQYVIRGQSDVFLRTTRVRHEKSSSSGSGGSGGGGGSSHRGSGGHSFGGGGGKF